MKKLLSFFLIICLLLSLISCGGYEPIESSEEERRVVMTLSYGGENYEVKYELYRAMFLTLKSSVDGGDSSLWTGDEKEEYIEKIDGLILERIVAIYGTIHAAKEIGEDVFSDDYDDTVTDYIKASVDGGEINSQYFEGFGGDYDKYLASLKEQYLNYSVQDLLIRYALAAQAVTNYYTPSVEGAEGEISFTDETLRDFYFGDECVRVLTVFLDETIWTQSSAKSSRDAIAALNSEEDVALKMISLTTSGASDVKNGMIITKNNLDAAYYSELTEAAFDLPMFEVSEPIYVTTGESAGYYIIYQAQKTDDNFTNMYEHIAEAYVNEKIGEILSGIKENLKDSAVYSEYLDTLDRSNVKMD